MNPPIILESIIFVKLIDLGSDILILDNIIDFLKKHTKNKKVLDEMIGYKQKYGV